MDLSSSDLFTDYGGTISHTSQNASHNLFLRWLSMSQYIRKYSPEKASALKAQSFDRSYIAGRGLEYEKLDQLTMIGVFGQLDGLAMLQDPNPFG